MPATFNDTIESDFAFASFAFAFSALLMNHCGQSRIGTHPSLSSPANRPTRSAGSRLHLQLPSKKKFKPDSGNADWRERGERGFVSQPPSGGRMTQYRRTDGAAVAASCRRRAESLSPFAFAKNSALSPISPGRCLEISGAAFAIWHWKARESPRNFKTKKRNCVRQKDGLKLTCSSVK